MKMSFVTAAMLYLSRRARQSFSINAVLPDPTGLDVGDLNFSIAWLLFLYLFFFFLFFSRLKYIAFLYRHAVQTDNTHKKLD